LQADGFCHVGSLGGTVPRSSGGQGKRAQTPAQSLKSREIAADSGRRPPPFLKYP
jgi:hypothetical protein